MSRVIPIALQTHLEGSTRTLAVCLSVAQVQPGSSTVLRVTTLNRPLVVSGDTYAPLGLMLRDLTGEDNMDVGTTEADGILDSDYITEDDIRAGRWDAAEWEMFRVNYASPTDGRIHLGNGRLGEIRWGRVRFTAELLDMMQGLKTSIGFLTSALCIHRLGDSGGKGRGNGCQVDLGPHTVTGTIDSVESDFYTINVSDRTEDDATFSNGILTITDGVMAGMQFGVRAYITGVIVLFNALPYDAAGAAYSLVRGCDKTKRTCIDVFDNVENRLAFDYVQGRDAAMQVGRHTG